MRNERSLGVDMVRFIAICGVVLIHMAPNTPAAETGTRFFSLFAVPFFLTISLYFFAKKATELREFRIGASGFDRLIVPYFAWTFIYLALRVLKFRQSGAHLQIAWIDVLFFGGAAVHLYFLPLLLFLQLVALLFAAWKRPLSNFALLLPFATLGAAALVYAEQSARFGFGGILLRGAGFLILSQALVTLTDSKVIERSVFVIFGVITGVAAILFVAAKTILPGASQGAPFIGFGIAALALLWPLQIKSTAVRWLLTCSYGIYLAHFGFLEAFEFIADKTGHPLAPYTIAEKLGMLSIILACCVVFIAVVRKIPLLAYVLLGEKQRKRDDVERGLVAQGATAVTPSS